MSNTNVTDMPKANANDKTETVTSRATRAATAAGVPLGIQARRPQKTRRNRLALSLVLVCLLPTLIGGIYYAFYASDRYAASAGFAVRGVDSGGGADMLSSLTGLASSGSTTSDSYIILRYLESRDLIEQLSDEIDLRAEFQQAQIDSISRLGVDATAEEFVDYWGRRLFTTFDATSGIITFEVQAFSADASQEIAALVLTKVRDLVNGLSASARTDSVHFAQQEVSRAEARLRDVQLQIRHLRTRESSINPTTGAELEAKLINELETQLVDLKARVATLRSTVGEGAPALVRLEREARSLSDQIDQRRAAISGEAGESGAAQGAADVMATFENLEIELTFAQQNYATALSSLESARIEADRQHRYLAVYSHPLLPQEPIYPRRIRNIFLVALISLGVWAIGTLATYAVRDHMS